jgi:hypothetical protein
MNPSTLKYRGIERTLLDRFPELRVRVQQEFGSYYDLKTEMPEAYPVFEDVLQPFVLELLDRQGANPFLTRIFAFFEEMAGSPDRDVTDLLGIAFLGPLVIDRERVRGAWKYMGERTKELARENARSGGSLESLPRDASGPDDGN